MLTLCWEFIQSLLCTYKLSSIMPLQSDYIALYLFHSRWQSIKRNLEKMSGFLTIILSLQYFSCKIKGYFRRYETNNFSRTVLSSLLHQNKHLRLKTLCFCTSGCLLPMNLYSPNVLLRTGFRRALGLNTVYSMNSDRQLIVPGTCLLSC